MSNLFNNVKKAAYSFLGLNDNQESKQNLVDEVINVNQQGQVQDSTWTQTGFFDGDQWSIENFTDTLYDQYQPLEGLPITAEFVRQIDEACANDGLLGTCYTRLLNMADTKFEVEIELQNKNEDYKKKLIKRLEEEFPKNFYACLTLRDVASLIIGRLLRYGYFGAQIVPTPLLSDIQEVRIPRPHSIRWIRQNNKWVLAYWDKGQTIQINQETFVYVTLDHIQNNSGIWPIPPLKAALSPLHGYKLFVKSLHEVARRTGNQKIIDISIKSDPIQSVLPNATAGSLTENEQLRKMKQKMAVIASQMRQSMPNGFIIHPDTWEAKDLATIEPPAHIITLYDIFISQLISAAKLFPALVGIQGKENQTTLASTQKQVIKSFIESVQYKTDVVLRQFIKEWLILNDIVFDDIRIEREGVQLESALDDEKAKQVKLQNEKIERELEDDSLVVSGDANGEDNTENNQSAKNQDSEQETESETVEVETKSKPKKKAKAKT